MRSGRPPDDETYQKFDFYFDRVEELVVADPASTSLTWWCRGSRGTFEPVEASPLLGVNVANVAGLIDWP